VIQFICIGTAGKIFAMFTLYIEASSLWEAELMIQSMRVKISLSPNNVCVKWKLLLLSSSSLLVVMLLPLADAHVLADEFIFQSISLLAQFHFLTTMSVCV